MSHTNPEMSILDSVSEKQIDQQNMQIRPEQRPSIKQLPKIMRSGPKLEISKIKNQEEIPQSSILYDTNQKNFYEYNKYSKHFQVQKVSQNFRLKKLYKEATENSILPNQNYIPIIPQCRSYQTIPNYQIPFQANQMNPHMNYYANQYNQSQMVYYPYFYPFPNPQMRENQYSYQQSYQQSYQHTYQNPNYGIIPPTSSIPKDSQKQIQKPVSLSEYSPHSNKLPFNQSSIYINDYQLDRIAEKNEVFEHKKNNNNKYPCGNNKNTNKFYPQKKHFKGSNSCNNHKKSKKQWSQLKKSYPETSIYIKNTKVSIVYGKILQRTKDALAIPYYNENLNSPLVNQIIKRSVYDLKVQIIKKIHKYCIRQTEVISFKSIGIDKYKGFFLVKICDLDEEDLNQHKNCLRKSLLNIFLDIEECSDESLLLPYLLNQRLPISQGADIMITTILKYFMENESKLKDVTICLQKKTEYSTIIKVFRQACDQFMTNDQIQCL